MTQDLTQVSLIYHLSHLGSPIQASVSPSKRIMGEGEPVCLKAVGFDLLCFLGLERDSYAVWVFQAASEGPKPPGSSP